MRLLGNVAMLDMNRYFSRRQLVLELLDQNHRTVTTTGTAQRKRQAAFSFPFVERQREIEQFVKSLQKSARFFVFKHVLFHLVFQTCFGPQRCYEMRIGEKAHVQDNVCPVRHAILIPEGQKKKSHSPRAGGLAEALFHFTLELV